MSNAKDERDVYYIPPNFLTSGRLFGGMMRVRNAIEACVLVIISGFPIIHLPFSLTVRVIILCLITLPLGILGVVGIDGDSLSEFAVNWVKWMMKRRILYRSDVADEHTPTKINVHRPVEGKQHIPPEQLGIKIKQPHASKHRHRTQISRRRHSAKADILHLYAEANDVALSTAYEELCRIFRSGERVPERTIHKSRAKVKQSKPALDLATVEVRDNTYSNLLSLLSLGTAHRESLLGRGLSGDEIVRLGYRTTPAVRSPKIVAELLERGCDLRGVPGFFVDEDTGKWKLDIRATGIMIPDRNLEGQIEAIQIRLDHDKNSKFNTLTSVERYYGAVASCCPHFTGVDDNTDSIYLTEGVMKADNKTFIYACKRAYSDAEWLQMEKEARLLTGEEHSNVLSMELTGYEVPRGVFFMGRNTPTLTMSNRILSFNKACHERLGNCPYIEVLYHPILQTLIVRSADAESTNAVRWITPEGKPISYISAKAYMGSIYDKMEWIRDYRFKFRGISRERGTAKILFFHLEEPRIIAGKRKGPMQTTNGISESESTIQYIPYKDKHNSEAPQFVGRAYPVEWTDAKIGVSLSLRKHRDALIHTITEEDITEPGLKITNPMIGELPDINAVQEEVKGLLVSM